MRGLNHENYKRTGGLNPRQLLCGTIDGQGLKFRTKGGGEFEICFDNNIASSEYKCDIG